VNPKPAKPARRVLVDARTRGERVRICRACPERQFHTMAKIEVCGKCGCWIITKTRFASAKCPLSKW
jgi:hypothetical protein